MSQPTASACATSNHQKRCLLPTATKRVSGPRYGRKLCLQLRPDMALSHGMHHITAIGSDIHRTDAFYRDLLGLRLVKQTSNFDDPKSKHWYWGVGDGKPGTLITYFERDPNTEPRARMGAGQTHHFALSVPDEDTQLVFREKLIRAGYRVSPVMDRIYFKSRLRQRPRRAYRGIGYGGAGLWV